MFMPDYFHSSLSAWVVREYIETISAKKIQKFAKYVLRKRKAAITIQKWWKDYPHFEKI